MVHKSLKFFPLQLAYTARIDSAWDLSEAIPQTWTVAERWVIGFVDDIACLGPSLDRRWVNRVFAFLLLADKFRTTSG